VLSYTDIYRFPSLKSHTCNCPLLDEENHVLELGRTFKHAFSYMYAGAIEWKYLLFFDYVTVGESPTV
jgi:hypothetical protein